LTAPPTVSLRQRVVVSAARIGCEGPRDRKRLNFVGVAVGGFCRTPEFYATRPYRFLVTIRAK